MSTEALSTAVDHAHGTAGQPANAGLARDLGELARELRAENSLEAVLDRIVHAAIREIDPAEHVGISEIHGKRVMTRSASSALMQQIDHDQYRSEEGPCLTALRDQVTVRSDDLTIETRWPVFAAAASSRGVKSMLSVQLFVEDDNLGALNLCSSHINHFTAEHESTAMVLAAHAAVAMKGMKTETSLRLALENRDVIGQAKGILMERFKIGSTEAFDLLAAASQRRNRKLHELAEELATTGELRLI